MALRDGVIAEGGKITFGRGGVAADPTGSVAFFDGSTVEADLVVGADGINSRVRDSLGSCGGARMRVSMAIA